MPTSRKKPFLTETVKRFTITNVLLFFLILLILNFILIYFVSYILNNNLDARLKHEIENILATIKVEGDTVEVFDFSELNEPDLKELTEHPFFLQIFNRSGEVYIQSDNISLFKPIPIDTNYSLREFISYDLDVDQASLRVAYFPIRNSKGESVATLQLSVLKKESEHIFSQLVQFNFISLPVIFLLIIIASIIMAKRSFAPLNKIIDTANKIGAIDLKSRIDVKASASDEIGRLRDTLNGLFDRIDSYIDELSNFTNQASHQLMNPLTAVQNEIDYLLKKDRTEDEYKKALRELQLQTSKMITIVKTLLIIAKSGKVKSPKNIIFNLSKLVDSDIRSLFHKANIVYHLEGDIYIKGESEKYSMALNNVINNAIKYSDTKSEINVKLYSDNDLAILEVMDHGIGIGDDEKEKVFQRFYRSNKIEQMGIQGFGLGLSLVKSVVDESSGEIIILDNKPNGTIIKIILPLVKIS